MSDIPASFFINIALAVSLTACSGWFLYANRDIEEADDFEDESVDSEHES